MKKSELIKKIMKETGLSRAQAEKAVELVLESVTPKDLLIGSLPLRKKTKARSRDLLSHDAGPLPKAARMRKLTPLGGGDDTDDDGPSMTRGKMRVKKR